MLWSNESVEIVAEVVHGSTELNTFQSRHAATSLLSVISELPEVKALVEVLQLGKQIEEAIYWGCAGDKNKQAAVRGFKRKRAKALAPFTGEK